MNEEDKQTSQTSQVSQVSQVSQTPEETESPQEEKASSPTPLGSRSVFAYLAVLFGVAFLLLLFAYLMQQRDSAEIMGNLSDLRTSMGSIQSIDQLTEENRALREEIEGLKEQVTGLEQERDELMNELEISDGIISVKELNQQEAWNIIAALDTVARVRTLYEEDRLDEARELLTALPRKDGTDEVEYYLSIPIQKGHGIVDPELYNPLTEWQELKEALAEEEEAG